MGLSYHATDTVETQKSKRILLETLIVLVLTVVPSLLWPGFKRVSVLFVIAYLFIERHLRHRSWEALGFDRRGIKPALAANWFLIVLVAVLVQLAVFLLAGAFLPAFVTHVKSRIPFFDATQFVQLVLLLLFTTLGEEMAYRALFQERLSWFIGTPLAIILVSVVFGVVHIAPGDPGVVAIDVVLVILDSLLFGLIFSRGKNIYVTWLAHFLGDVVGIVLLFWL